MIYGLQLQDTPSEAAVQTESSVECDTTVKHNTLDVSPVSASLSVLALGSELKALLEQPERANIGDLAAVVERLRNEFRMIADVDLLADQVDDYADLFADAQTRDFSLTDIGQMESILKNLQ
jgi:hypothetical protein